MPSWLPAYLAVFGVFLVIWMIGLVRGGDRRWLLAESGSALCLILVALAYWMGALREFVAPVALPLFLVGLAWLGLGALRSYRSHRARHPQPGHVHVAAAAAGALGMLLVSGPLLYWAFEVAVRGRFAAG